MNKLAKGAIAGAAGIALLMGGAGTLAYWNDSADVLAANQQISSGDLKITAGAAAGAWSVKPATGTVPTLTSGTSQSIANIATFKMVPGDVVEYTKSVDITAVGTTLKLQLSLAPGSITSTSNALSTELASATTMVIDGTLPSGFTLVSPGVYSVTPGTYTNVPIKVTINWLDAGTPVAASENGAKNQSVTFGAFAVQVKQVFN